MREIRRLSSTISISVAPTTQATGKRYFDLSATIELMNLLWKESLLDGFEFQNLAEWDDENPPMDEREKRFPAWNESLKHTTTDIANSLEEAGLPILSVHANRDIGICLCSDYEEDISRGNRLIHETLFLADRVGAPLCVFHLWDTRKGDFDPGFLQDILLESAAEYPSVKASVENVPIHLAGFTPFELVRQFEWITLDLQWAALYDELDRFESVKERIVNIHLRGRLEGSQWVMDSAPFGFYEALETIRDKWGYSGLLTMEPIGLCDGDWDNLVAALSTLT